MEDQVHKFEFPLDKGLNLPKNMVLHRFDDRYLFIASEKGMWLTVDEIRADLVQSLGQGNSLGKVIRETMDRRQITEHGAICKMKLLLKQVAVKQFYEDTVPIENAIEPLDFNLQLHLTQQCNLRCKHCYMDSGVASLGELDLTEWKDIVDQFADLGGKSVTYSGGEPLMFTGFYELADYVKQRNLDTLLITNGMLIQDASTAELVSRQVDKIRISVDGATAEVHERIRGKGTFVKVNKAIELLSKTDIWLEMAITIFPENLDDVVQNLRNYLIHLHNQGVRLDKVGIGRGMRQGRARDSVDVLYFESKYREIHRQLYGAFWDLKIYKPIKTVECGYGRGLTISSTGDVFPCGEYFSRGANIKTHRLSDVYSQFKRDRQRSSVYNMPLCKNCDLRFICGGGCRIENIKRNGDLCRPVCFPDKRRKYYQRLIGRDEVFQITQRLERSNV